MRVNIKFKCDWPDGQRKREGQEKRVQSTLWTLKKRSKKVKRRWINNTFKVCCSLYCIGVSEKAKEKEKEKERMRRERRRRRKRREKERQIFTGQKRMGKTVQCDQKLYSILLNHVA